MPGPEFALAEAPCVRELAKLGYGYLPPAEPKARARGLPPESVRPADNELARDGLNQVLLREELVEAVRRINDVPEEVARAAYLELLAEGDNEAWTKKLRGDYSRTVPGAATKRTIRLIDFLEPGNNTWTVTNQLYVRSQRPRIPDVVVYVNGIPLVVIEAKSPLAHKDKSGEAFEQIKQYERDVPRLFYSNLLSIVTNGVQTLFGATGAPNQFWGVWRDPWPRWEADFESPLAKDLWCLLEPVRLLDLLAHFVVFEREEETVVKKICRYQQFRAVNKIAARVHKKGLIWHTQGSGKSLTMVFAALKLKTHRTIDDPALANPSLMVVTDRKDLDRQIGRTFKACGLANPKRMRSIKDLRTTIGSGTAGLTALSTIQKFEGSAEAAPGHENWIVLVDEAHRSQEKDLGAYLRATLPSAWLFGFTGTPVKTTDKNTYANFGVEGEGYLDRYSIDDAVADGATVPIRYTSRKTEWQIDPAKLDVLFDQWFVDQPDEWVEEIKRRGVTIADLARHPGRVGILAYDLWTHFSEHFRPDGFKGQIVGIDRAAVVLFKRALDREIAASLAKDGVSAEEAASRAGAMSACVYSSSQEDAKPSEDPYVAGIRKDLVRWALDDEDEKEAVKRFNDPNDPLSFLIVCNKLLTGFDAPIESVMYLDSPLREHSLLQAIARTNRLHSIGGVKKPYGLIVDYIGVTRRLGEALASYREADVQNALRDLAQLEGELEAAHREVMAIVATIARGTGNLKAEYDTLLQALGAEDAWLTFRRRARRFIRAYEALSPDPEVLPYTEDLKWVASFLPYARLHFEKKSRLDLPDFSAKIRDMLAEHLHVTGLRTLLKLRKVTDPEYWEDFGSGKTKPDDLKEAAVHKAAELKAETAERAEENPLRYGRFSERVLEIIRRMDRGLEDVGTLFKELEQVAREFATEQRAHEDSGLSETAYGISRILHRFQPEGREDEVAESGIANLAEKLDALYASDATAPAGWHLKEQLKKELRQAVRLTAHRSGLDDVKQVAARVEEFALKHFVKLS